MGTIYRRKTRHISVGTVPIGGNAPIPVQTKVTTDPRDWEITVAQIHEAAEAGADIVRIAVPDREAIQAFAWIRAQVTTPLVADIRHDYRLALKAIESGADGLRINPASLGKRERVAAVVEAAKHHGLPLRIGVNSHSLERRIEEKYGQPNANALVDSARRHIELLEGLGFYDLKVSLKCSDLFTTVEACRKLAAEVEYPFHLGITGLTDQRMGTVRAAIGLGILLADGIGDTLRVSLGDPVEEVKVGHAILESLKLPARGGGYGSQETGSSCLEEAKGGSSQAKLGGEA